MPLGGHVTRALPEITSESSIIRLDAYGYVRAACCQDPGDRHVVRREREVPLP